MSTKIESRTNFISLLKSLFSSEIDVPEYEKDIELPTDLKDALKTLESKEKEAEKAINVANASKKVGFTNKINPIKNGNTEKAMRAKYEQVMNKEDKER